jgi:hypothetical protein
MTIKEMRDHQYKHFDRTEKGKMICNNPSILHIIMINCVLLYYQVEHQQLGCPLEQLKEAYKVHQMTQLNQGSHRAYGIALINALLFLKIAMRVE